MTRNLKLFAAFGLAWSVVFFSALHWCLFDPEARWPFIVAAAITYGLGYALAGWQLGKRDSNKATRLNLEFWYYAASNLTSLFVGGAWILLFKRSDWFDLVVMAVVFSAFLAIAALSSRKTIKGIEKNKLFQ